ncbi:FAD-dependent monooxygenase [Actinoplanes friuliensis]|uniref:2-polyprenyl-6-methoxyphenol hydroxylase-like oxidoreductase n=1 Tax=Actinoplanes friuliensis DSM 7358 TaxID=1246995 RepID=U5VUS6_9ACTN|nr:FAD-dependent monooxygenase [Actinoplanes friuliensis]AGZ39406.1 2-polyprenyl-6-methoxyphenol hydroxylase-like oxidoreductase [Actinoplanes friuliensis DSM 7358]
MPGRTVLISGASVAGPALAYWLEAAGWQATIVERAAELRSEGQNIDIRGAAREVVRRMGLEDTIRAAGTGEEGTRIVDAGGRTRASFPATRSDTAGATAELEILRGELSRIVVAQTSAEYLFGTTITAVHEDEDGVAVSFTDGPDRRFDVVVLAEGMRSRTRTQVFGTEARIRHLGMYTSYFTIPKKPGDPDWWQWYNAVGGRNLGLRPDNLGTMRATLSFLSPPRGYEDLGQDEQKQLLHRVFRDAGWEAPRMLAAMDDAELYFENLGQVFAPTWHRGRIALLGDAAYCASPLSGMGTSLALVGAYVLGGELSRATSHREAFANYERLMRPYVDKAQKLIPGGPRLANPKSRLGIKVLQTTMGVAARIGSLSLLTPPADKFELPTYS